MIFTNIQGYSSSQTASWIKLVCSVINKDKEFGSGETGLLKDSQSMWNPFKYGTKIWITATEEM